MEDQISKKELLRQTGISYGQLYRWKREKLIPEEWFKKQASSTGQETYFPKEAVLKRVERIKAWKDQYSLEEMAAMLSPEYVDRLFSEEDLEQFSEIDIDIAASFMDFWEKDEFTYREIIAMVMLSKIKQELSLSQAACENLIESLMASFQNLHSLAYLCVIFGYEEQYLYALYPVDQEVFFDMRLQRVCEISMQEISNQMKEKYQTIFHFVSE